MSARKKSSGKSKKSSNLGKQKKQTAAQLPDLEPILVDYLDAYSILHAAYDRLEQAHMQLSRYGGKGSKS